MIPLRIRRYFRRGKLVAEHHEPADAARVQREAEDRYRITHPADVPRIAGCCDPPPPPLTPPRR